jgi:hypothetical protein
MGVTGQCPYGWREQQCIAGGTDARLTHAARTKGATAATMAMKEACECGWVAMGV